MQFDLESMTRQELVKLRAEVEKAITTAADRDRRSAIDAAQRAVAEYGFNLADLTGADLPKSRGRKSNAPPKYRNPGNPEQTWSGRGRRPDWVNAALAEGKGLSDLEI